MDEVYNELRARSSNDGVTDIALMTGADAQVETARGEGSFELHRIGDAVASRDSYSAVYDAYRLCSRL
jgi:hypothetical protein